MIMFGATALAIARGSDCPTFKHMAKQCLNTGRPGRMKKVNLLIAESYNPLCVVLDDRDLGCGAHCSDEFRSF